MGRRKKSKRRGDPDKLVPDLVPAEVPPVPNAQNRRFFVTIMLIALGLSAWIFLPFATALITGLLLAYFAYPVYRFFKGFLRIRWISGLMSLLFIFALVVFPLAALGVALADDVQNLAQRIESGEPPEVVMDGLAFYARFQVEDPNNETQVQQEQQRLIQETTDTISDYLIQEAPNLLGMIGAFLIGLFIVAFVMYYVFVDGEGLVTMVRRTLPLPPHQTDYLLRETGNAVDAIFIGQIGSALIQGLVGGIGFYIFGVPNAVFWGAIMAVLSLLPVIGTPIVWVPAGLFLIIEGDTFNGLGLLIYSAVLTMNVDNLVKPLLIGDRADIHPVFVLVGILGGIAVFGVIGFIVGPLVLALTIAVVKVWNDHYHDHHGWVRPAPQDRVGPPRGNR